MRWLRDLSRHVRRHRGGASLVEAMIAVSLMGVLAFVVLDVQSLIIRNSKVTEGDTVAHRALRQSVVHLFEDLLKGSSATVVDNVLTITQTVSGAEHTVQYSREGKRLRRVERDGGGQLVHDRYIAYDLDADQGFTVEYDADHALVTYTLAAWGDQQRLMQLTGAIHLRNAN